MNTTPRSEQWCIPIFVVVPCEEAGGPILHSSNTHQSLGKKLAATYCNYSNIYLHTMSSQQKFWKWPLACSLACRKKTCLVTKVYRNNRWPRNTQPVKLISLCHIPVNTERSHMMINVVNLKWYLRSDFLMHHELTESVLYIQQISSQYSQIIQAGKHCNCHAKDLWQPRWNKS